MAVLITIGYSANDLDQSIHSSNNQLTRQLIHYPFY